MKQSKLKTLVVKILGNFFILTAVITVFYFIGQNSKNPTLQAVGLPRCGTSDNTCLLGTADGSYRYDNVDKCWKWGCVIGDVNVPCSSCAVAVCGNGVIDAGEACDQTNLNSQTCVTQGFASGALSCNSSCQFNTSACVASPTPPPPPPGNSLCGTANEVCLFGFDPSPMTCAGLGYTGGTLACDPFNCRYDTSGCLGAATNNTPTPPEPAPGSNCLTFANCDQARAATARCEDGSAPEVIPAVGDPDCTADCSWFCVNTTNGYTEACRAQNTFTCNKPDDPNPLTMGVNNQFVSVKPWYNLCFKNGKLLDDCSGQVSDIPPSPYTWTCGNQNCFACPKAKCLPEDEVLANYLATGIISCKDGKVALILGTVKDKNGVITKVSADYEGKVNVPPGSSLVSLSWKCQDVGDCQYGRGETSCSLNLPYCGDGKVQKPNAAGFDEECDSSLKEDTNCTPKATEITTGFPEFAIYQILCEKDNGGDGASIKGIKIGPHPEGYVWQNGYYGSCSGCQCVPKKLSGGVCLKECGAEAASQADCADKTFFDPATCTCVGCLTDDDCAKSHLTIFDPNTPSEYERCEGDIFIKSGWKCESKQCVKRDLVPTEDCTKGNRQNLCENGTGPKSYDKTCKCELMTKPWWTNDVLNGTYLGYGCNCVDSTPKCVKGVCSAECSEGEVLEATYRNLGLSGSACFIANAYQDKRECDTADCKIKTTRGGECGDGNLDSWTDADGVVHGEECDDGNNIDGDGCDANCFVECGDGDNSAVSHTARSFDVADWFVRKNQPKFFCGNNGAPRNLRIYYKVDGNTLTEVYNGSDYIDWLDRHSTYHIVSISWSCSDLECYKCGTTFPGCNIDINNQFAYMGAGNTYLYEEPENPPATTKWIYSWSAAPHTRGSDTYATSYNWRDFTTRFSTPNNPIHCRFLTTGSLQGGIMPDATLSTAKCTGLCSRPETEVDVKFENSKWTWTCGAEACEVKQMGCGSEDGATDIHGQNYFYQNVQKPNVGCLNGGRVVWYERPANEDLGFYGYDGSRDPASASDTRNRGKWLWRCEYDTINQGVRETIQAPRSNRTSQTFDFDGVGGLNGFLPRAWQDNLRWCSAKERGECPSEFDTATLSWKYNLTWDRMGVMPEAPGAGLWPGESTPLNLSDLAAKVNQGQHSGNKTKDATDIPLCKHGIARRVTLKDIDQFQLSGFNYPTSGKSTVTVDPGSTLGRWLDKPNEVINFNQTNIWDHSGYVYYSPETSKAFWICDHIFDWNGQYSGNDTMPYNGEAEVCYTKISTCKKPPHGEVYTRLKDFMDIFKDGDNSFFWGCFKRQGLVYDPEPLYKAKCDAKLCESGEATNFKYNVPVPPNNNGEVVNLTWQCSDSACQASSKCAEVKKIEAVTVSANVPYTCNGNEATYTANYTGNCDQVKYAWRVTDADANLVNNTLYSRVTGNSLTLTSEDQLALGQDASRPGSVSVTVSCEDDCADLTAATVEGSTTVVKTYNPSVEGTINKESICASESATINYTIKDGVEADGTPICTLAWEDNNFSKTAWSDYLWNTALDGNNPKINGEFLIKKLDPGFFNNNQASAHYPANWRYRAKMICACNPEKRDIPVKNTADNSELFYIKIGPSYELDTKLVSNPNTKIVCQDEPKLSLTATETKCVGLRTFTWKQDQGGTVSSLHSEGPTSDTTKNYDLVPAQLARGTYNFWVEAGCSDTCVGENPKASDKIEVIIKNDQSSVTLEPTTDQEFCSDDANLDIAATNFRATYNIPADSACSTVQKDYHWSLYKSSAGCASANANDAALSRQESLTDNVAIHNLKWIANDNNIPVGIYWLGVDVACTEADANCVKDTKGQTCVKVEIKRDQRATDGLSLYKPEKTDYFCGNDPQEKAAYVGNADCSATNTTYVWKLTKTSDSSATPVDFTSNTKDVDLSGYLDNVNGGDYKLEVTVKCSEPCFNEQDPTSSKDFTVKPKPILGEIANIDSLYRFCANAPQEYTTTVANCTSGKLTWTLKNKASNQLVETKQNIIGADNLAYRPKTGLSPDIYSLEAKLECLDPCVGTETKQIDLEVKALPEPGAIAQNQEICANEDPEAFTSTDDGKYCENYYWQSASVANDGSCSGVTWGLYIERAGGVTYDPGPLSSSTCYRRLCANECDTTGRGTAPLKIKVTPTFEIPTVTLSSVSGFEACQDTTNLVTANLTYSDDSITDCTRLSYEWSVSGSVVTDGNSDDTTFDVGTLRANNSPFSLTVKVTCLEECPRTNKVATDTETINIYECICGSANDKSFVGGANRTLNQEDITNNNGNTKSFRFCKDGCSPESGLPLNFSDASDRWEWTCKCGNNLSSPPCLANRTACGEASSAGQGASDKIYTDASWMTLTKSNLCKNSAVSWDPSGWNTQPTDELNTDEPDGNTCNGGGDGTGIKDIWKWNCEDNAGKQLPDESACSAKRLACGVADANRVLDNNCKIQPYDATDGYRGSYSTTPPTDHKCNLGSTYIRNEQDNLANPRGKWYWECGQDSLANNTTSIVKCEATRDCGWMERTGGSNGCNDGAKFATVNYGAAGCWTSEDVGICNSSTTVDMTWGKATRIPSSATDTNACSATQPYWSSCKGIHCFGFLRNMPSNDCYIRGVCNGGSSGLFSLPTDAEWHTLEAQLSSSTCNGSRVNSNSCYVAGNGNVSSGSYGLSEDGLKDPLAFRGVAGVGYWTNSQKRYTAPDGLFCVGTSCPLTLPYYEIEDSRWSNPSGTTARNGDSNNATCTEGVNCPQHRVRCYRPQSGNIIGGGGLTPTALVPPPCYGWDCPNK